MKKEQKTEWFKKINPKGQVPAIKDGDHCMGESVDICKYFIESRKLNHSFYPVDDTDKINQINEDLELTEDVIAAVMAAAFAIVFGPMGGAAQPSEDKKQELLSKVAKQFDRVEALLGRRKTKFLNCGSTFAYFLTF